MTERYTFHLATYSKLLRGWNSSGPITQGAEARIVSHSRHLPEGLHALCDPQTYFRDLPPLIAMDARLMPGGAFLYMPFVTAGGHHYSVFGRLEARSEAGEGKPGRKFIHFVTLIVEDKWEPGLIPWAARMLFEWREPEDDGFAWGEPVSENYPDRSDRPIPDLIRDELSLSEETEDFVDGWPLEQNSDGSLNLRAALPKLRDERWPQVRLAEQLATDLFTWEMKTHGRWLSFAMGVSSSVEAPGPGFAIRLDDCKNSDDSPVVSLRWSDRNPPFVQPDIGEKGATHRETPSSIYGINWQRMQPLVNQPGDTSRVMPTERMFWPDQRPKQDEPTAAVLGVDKRVDQRADQIETANPQSDKSNHTIAPSVHNETLDEAFARPPAQGSESADNYPNLAPRRDPTDHNISELIRHQDQDAAGFVAPSAPAPSFLVPPVSTSRHPSEPEQGIQVDTHQYPAETDDQIFIDWPPIRDLNLAWVQDPSLPRKIKKRFEVFLWYRQVDGLSSRS